MVTDEMVEKALNEGGSGWGIHLDRDAKRWLMRAALEAALSAVEPVKTAFEVASKHIPEARVSLLSRAIRQGLNDYGWKNFGTLPEMLMGYIVQAERAEAEAHPKQSAPSVAVENLITQMHDAIDEYRDGMKGDKFGPHEWPTVDGIKTTVEQALRRSALSAQVQDESEIVDCLLAGKPFIFDPATNFCHADDGGAPEHGIKYVPAAQVQDVAGWQSMDTAPRNGTTVLLYAPGWDSPKTGWTYGKDDWQDCPYSHKGSENYLPTHWMPLPEAPANQEG